MIDERRHLGNLSRSVTVAQTLLPLIACALALSGCSERAKDEPYYDFTVDSQATIRTLENPEISNVVAAAGIAGTVLTQFVVDTSGRADLRTVRILTSLHPLLDERVRKSISTATFSPAMLKGKRVRVLVRLPFEFAPSAFHCPESGHTGLLGFWKSAAKNDESWLRVDTGGRAEIRTNRLTNTGRVQTTGDSVFIEISGWRPGARMVGLRVRDALELAVQSLTEQSAPTQIFCKKRSADMSIAMTEDANSNLATSVRSDQDPLTSETVLRFPKYAFEILVPRGWVAAPDSPVERVRHGFNPTLMNDHELVAILVPEEPKSWDDEPSIRVLINSQINTEPRVVVAALRKAIPTMEESMDSLVKLTPTWTSASMTNPIWDARRNTLWAVSRFEATQGSAFTLSAARMYRGGQISIHYNCRKRSELVLAYRVVPEIVDNLRIPKRLDW